MTDNRFLELYAPVSGKTVPIESVPDLVFAQKTIGDGVSVAPSSYVLCAPCDGVVKTVHAGRHALTMQAGEIEILMHIGLDTVLMKGDGFNVKTAVGKAVKKGDALIEFSREKIEQSGRSLLTEIVVVNMERAKNVTSVVNKDVQVGKDVVLTIELNDDVRKNKASGAAGMHAQSWGITIKNPAGIHARPAAVLVNAAKQFPAEVKLELNGRAANAKSLVSVMELGVGHGDTVRLIVDGANVHEVMTSLVPLIEAGLGEDLTKAVAEAPAVVEEKPAHTEDKAGEFHGVPSSGGVVCGVVMQLRDVAVDVAEFGEKPEVEKKKLQDALAAADAQLAALFEQTQKTAGADKAAIFAAHRELLGDPELMEKTVALIDDGRSAAFAWQQTINKEVAAFREMKNALLAGRANDLNDVGRRVLKVLTGEAEQKLAFPENAVLIAQDLSPSDTATLDRDKVVGFATVGGGASSHASILARSLSLPAVSGLSENVLEIANGTAVLLDGDNGILILNPDEATRKAAAEHTENERKKRAEYFEKRNMAAVTFDNRKIEVCGNIGTMDEAGDVVANGGEGVGLLRSEFLFSGRKEAPSEDEQTAVYRAIAETLGQDRSLIVRTLDVGGDKPLSYMPQPKEANPFLGVRGVRLSLKNPEIFRAQIRAVLRAADKTKVRIMFPMVTTVDELKRAKEIVAQERQRLKAAAPVETGIMIEVPAAAMTADLLAPYADFFSIGTNDLTQYVMAADRGNAAVASLSDGLNPAVLRMIKATVDGAEKVGKWVGVCGGMAGDELAVPALIGLGVTELSVSPSAIPAIKALVRRLSFESCRRLALQLIECEDAAVVREKIKIFLEQPE